ncbi:hypothetical protein AMTR_s00018p00243590 [Amborella trichopoda]|uniref:Uncharacterized protein n=1 Tax=Amborella trichopoda TaxID=13333 RepID=W1PM82_AMBTC|nr:hypothetical protein AMTR_s00018p00243590 [Amborella trichopoda]
MMLYRGYVDFKLQVMHSQDGGFKYVDSPLMAQLFVFFNGYAISKMGHTLLGQINIYIWSQLMMLMHILLFNVLQWMTGKEMFFIS